ncbi:TetR/AcrR family transcriptional regulator [Gordonia sp. MP11Mi]|uniref:HTH tetR-type domain-containing protein n=1 Tax=Gordonia sp. MP11Mi TaxID=3022769 RepID=A0AA97CXD6_9ACTN
MVVAGDRANQLLDCALDAFLEVGYAPVGVKEITTRAGVSHGTFYNYFENKRQLLSVLVEREMADFFAVLTRVEAGLQNGCVEQTLRQAVFEANREMLTLVDDRAEVLSFIIIDVPGIDQSALDGHLAMFREASRRASAALQIAVDSGVADPDLHTDFAGQAWISYLLGVSAPAIADGAGLSDLDAVADALTVLLLDGLPAIGVFE